MDNAHASAGVNDTGEFLALDVPYDELLSASKRNVVEIARLQSTLIEVIEIVHATTHGTPRGPKYLSMIPPTYPWDQCRHITCRNVRAALLGDVAEEEEEEECPH